MNSSTKYAWYVLLVLFITYVISFIDRMMLNLLVGEIKLDLDLSDTRISLLQGLAFATFFLLAGIPLGRLADLKSRKYIIVFGVIVWSAATISCGYVETFWLMFVARMIVGIGEAALTPAAFSMLSDLFDKEMLGRALSIYSSGIWVGSGLALLLGGIFLQEVAHMKSVDIPGLGSFEPWQAAFLAVGFPGFLVALLVMTLREPARRSLHSITNNDRKAGDELPSFTQVLQFIGCHRRFFLAHFGGFALFTLLAQANLAWSPEVLVRGHAVSPATAGLWLGSL